LFSKLPPSPGLLLKSRKKHTISSSDALTRVRSIQDTLTEIIPLCIKIGVTRISDITFMDRLYIPNYSAILPGTEDLFWVYSGKGTTKSHAKASALMEAIERYSSLPSTCTRTFIQGSYLQLSKSHNKVLHPAEVVEPVNQEYNDKNAIMDFLTGFDLLTNEKVLVPADIGLYRYSPKHPAICAFSHSHTNGLASGNVLEEAICHALCEVIERDAVSIADLCVSSIPYNILEKIIDSLKNDEKGGYPVAQIPAEDKFVDDSSIFQDVDISEIAEEFEPIKRLVKKFSNAGIPLLIKDITQKDIGIPTFVASSVEWITTDYGYFAKGFGTHPDARIALIRAITEASQTRAANIQGARDDLKKIQYKENDEIYKRKWQFMPATSSSSSSLARQKNNNKNIIKFSEIKTYMNKDILDDINLILYSLKKAGLKRTIIVDLTNPNIGIPVVRAIVPGLETFEVTKSVMGRRAKEYFKRLYLS
jgi:ribosomal protein S12 methylthiotransferase accessory factor YcaO